MPLQPIYWDIHVSLAFWAKAMVIKTGVNAK
jgi:hypothetical protein